MKWYLIWTLWLLLSVAAFGVLEALALHSPTGITLSRSVYNLSQAWPPTVFIIGVVVGGLAVHFWWHWNP